MGTRVCHVHDGEILERGQDCQLCLNDLASDTNTMTPDEKAAEVLRWCGGVLEVRFNLMHKRIEQLMGRPVWTHEFADPDSLVMELKSGNQIGMMDVVDKLVDKVGKDRVIVVDMEGETEGC